MKVNRYALPEPSDVEKKMLKALQSISSDDKFLFGIRVTLETDELRREMNAAIEDGDVQTEEDAIYYAIQIVEEGVPGN
ncbi:hypothetical protein [Acidaminococcus timonensis]|uniref:hypothetical protein n=1 Tax=Acidaminococcus timonensis TaxID=1871002 RepID=UPI00248B2C2C|nr:hypothetical protein [Acidaminococcus timonensis]